MTAIINIVTDVEDLSFLISSFLVPKRNPARMLEMMNNLCFVSHSWNETFSLVRAQIRYDYLTQQLADDEAKGWMYHKLIYISGPDAGRRFLPREGCLRIFRSHVHEVCKEAIHEYRTNRQNDEHPARDRVDSRPDYYYRTHIEIAECIEIIPSHPLKWTRGNTFHVVNEIEWDTKPRLINQYWAQIDEINGMENPLVEGKSKEGKWNLGYHEIVPGSDSKKARLNQRPPRNKCGNDTTEFLRACNAKTLDAPRWVKLAHVIGVDHCKTFVKEHLLPMIGPRPSGKTWHKIMDI